MQSDTVIGIVGAVVLVGVMVGVFAYEYNNVEGDEPTAEEQRANLMAAFNETYPDFDPEGDLDGDGVPNYNEADLDGDGLNNTDDDAFDFKVEHDAGGSVSAAPSSSGYSLTFDAEPGVRHVVLTLSHPERLAADQSLLALDVELTANGESSTASPTTAGGTMTYVIEFPDPAAGSYMLTVTPFTLGGAVSLDPGTTVTGTLEFHYF